MSTTDLNMKDLFGVSGVKSVVMQDDAFDNAPSTVGLKRKLADISKFIQWDSVKDVLAEKTVEMLDVRMVNVFLPAWKKYREVMEFANPAKHPPDETSLVSLVEHTIKTVHHPFLQVRYRGLDLPKIEFTLSADLTLQGVVLCIRGGKIREIKDGRILGKGSLLLENETVIEKEFLSRNLGGSIDFGEGIQLRAAEAAAGTGN